MKTKIIIGLLCLILAGQSCYEDKGNYDYVPVNELVVTLRPATTNAFLGELYTFNPKIDFPGTSDSTDFVFWWEHRGLNSGPERADTICMGKELRFTPMETGYTNIRLYAREIATGFMSMADVQLNVKSSYAKGWLILSELNGRSTLSLIRPTYELDENDNKVRVFEPFKDIYAQFNPEEPLGSAPLKMEQILHNTDALVMVMQSSGSRYVNGSSYLLQPVTLDKEFVGDQFPEGFKERDFFHGISIDVIIGENSEMYSRNYGGYGTSQPFFSRRFNNIPVEMNGEQVQIERVIRCRAQNSTYFGMHDASKKRLLWMVVANSVQGALVPAEFTVEEGAEYIDFNNFGAWEFVFAGMMGESGMKGNIMVLFRKGEEMVVQQQLGTLPWPNPQLIAMTDVKYAPFKGAQYVSGNTRYFMTSTRPYLFFAEGNVLYWYDLTAHIVHAFYTFPEGGKVVKMDTNPQETELGVALEDGSFFVFNIRNEDLYKGEKIYEYSGLGRIADMKYKYPMISEYNNRNLSLYWD